MIVSIFGMLSVWAIPGDKVLAREFKAGTAVLDITPSLGGEIVGGFLPIEARLIHDPLHVRCLVLQSEDTSIVLVVCDLLGIHRAVSQQARDLIAQRYAIPPAHVMIAATHTHSATSAHEPRYSEEATLTEYQRFVVQRIVDAVGCALQRLEPAELGYAAIPVPEHVFNRRWFMGPGTIPPNPFGEVDQVKMNPPAGSPHLIEPAGPVDPHLRFLAIRAPTGRLISVFAAYSLHYVGGVGHGHVSADYFGMFCERLRELVEQNKHDPPFLALLANGTSGDVNNINFRHPRPAQPAYAQMRHVAYDLADKLYAALPQVSYHSQVKLAALYREVPIATRRPRENQQAWAHEILTQTPPAEGTLDLPRIYAQRVLTLTQAPAEVHVPVQVLRIGPVIMGTLPCEAFAEIGLEFTECVTRQPAFLVELAHGYYGYLPTPRQHAWGGYETWLGTNWLEIEASNKLLAHLLEMVDQLP